MACSNLRRLPSVAGFLFLAPAGAAQAVHVVDGGYADLGPVVLFAASGDTVLVRGGPYSGAIVTGKSLNLLADSPGGVRIDFLRIENLTAAQTVLVHGFAANVSGGQLDVVNCAGSVRLRALDLTVSASAPATPVTVVDSTDVALVDCVVRAPAQSTAGVPSGPALDCTNSRVAAYDCTFEGGAGAHGAITGFPLQLVLPRSGGAGARLDATSILFVSHAELRGGAGGNGTNAFSHLLGNFPATAGAAGGPGLDLNGGTAYVLDSVLAGGAGGPGGTGAPPGPAGPGALGAPVMLAGAHLEMDVPTHVREETSIAFTVTGTPGDPVWLGLSTRTRWHLDTSYAGVFLFGPAARRFFLGTVPGTGTLTASLPVGLLPPGVESHTLHLQSLTRNVQGQFVLGSPASLVVVDREF